jgi:hypothetical protein
MTHTVHTSCVVNLSQIFTNVYKYDTSIPHASMLNFCTIILCNLCMKAIPLESPKKVLYHNPCQCFRTALHVSVVGPKVDSVGWLMRGMRLQLDVGDSLSMSSSLVFPLHLLHD